MKVAFVTHQFPRLHNTFIQNEIVELLNQGVDVSIFSLAISSETVLNEEVKKYRLLDRTHYFSDHISPASSAINRFSKYAAPFEQKEIFYSLEAIAKKLKEEKFSIIHAAFGNRPATVSMILSEMANIPFTFEAHTYDLFVDFPFASEKIKSASALITESNYNRDFLLKALGAPAEKVRIIHLSPNKRMLDATVQASVCEDLIVSACRLQPIKGITFGLQAVSRLIKEFPSLLYLVIGGGILRRELEIESIELGLGEHVKFLDDLPNEEVCRLVKQSAVFLLPCVIARNGDRDGTPTAICEAMYLGVPVISSKIAGIPELVDDKENGILTEPGDVEQIVSGLRMLLKDRLLREKMGQSGRRKIERAFNIEKNTRELIEVWRQILGNNAVESAQVVSEQSTAPAPSGGTNFESSLETIKQYARTLLFREAASLSYQAGKTYNNPQLVIDACLYRLLSGDYSFVENVAAELCSAGLLQEPRLLKIFGFALLLDNKVDYARQVFTLLQGLDPNAPWVQQLIGLIGPDALSRMSKIEAFKPEIIAACSVNEKNSVRTVIKIKCKACGSIYRRKIDGTLLRFEFVPCESCLHPYATRPLSVLNALKKMTASYNPEEVVALDMLLWSWVHSWWKGRDIPREAVTESGANLYQLLYFNFRYALGEAYSKLLARGVGDLEI